MKKLNQFWFWTHRALRVIFVIKSLKLKVYVSLLRLIIHPSSFEFQNDIFFFTFIWFEIQSAGSFILCIMQDSLPLISSLNFIFYVHT